MTETPDPCRPLENIGEADKTRQKQPKKRSLDVLNEHSEAVYNEVLPTQVVFQRPASLCPICGQPNSCGQCDPATTSQPCWCFSVAIDPDARQRIPSEAQGKACICERCARGELPADS